MTPRKTNDDHEYLYLLNQTTGHNLGNKNDTGKPMYSCLPPEGLKQLGIVAELGARKYGVHNYRKGIQVTRTLDAAFRHLIAAVSGKDVDEKDGNNHLASVAWNVLVALQTIKDHPELDDRYKET